MTKNIFFVSMIGVALHLISFSAYAELEGMSARFAKMDARGVELQDASESWAIVRDDTTGLFWEVKTRDGSVHNKDNLYKWSSAKKNFIAEMNANRFGGFSDWRIPTSDELLSLVQKGEEPLINTDYFPNTEPSSYLSWRLCGSGEITTEKVSFGKTKVKGRSKYVRAVRGGEPN